MNEETTFSIGDTIKIKYNFFDRELCIGMCPVILKDIEAFDGRITQIVDVFTGYTPTWYRVSVDEMDFYLCSHSMQKIIHKNIWLELENRLDESFTR